MGLAALFVGVLIAVAIAVAIVYGTFVGLVRAGQAIWKFLVPEEAEDLAASEEETSAVPCWEEKDCPPSVRDACPAYIRRTEGLPCWLTNMRAEGRLKVSCLTCARFNVADLVA